MHVPWSFHTGGNTPDSDVETVLWVEELNLHQDHQDMILLGRVLNGDIINASQKLLSSQFPQVGGLQSTFHNDPRHFSRTTGVQIHYTGKYHWITSTTIGCSRICRARVFDSRWQNELSTETEIQLAQIYGAGDKDMLRVEVCPVQQQEGIVDCGVFATDLCHGLDPVAVSYCQEEMRAHLLTCLEMRELCPFPRTEKSGKMNARVMKTISVYCSCKLPKGYDTNMVECELCLQWYHYKCVGITAIQDTDKWWCNPCVQNQQKKRKITY